MKRLPAFIIISALFGGMTLFGFPALSSSDTLSPNSITTTGTPTVSSEKLAVSIMHPTATATGIKKTPLEIATKLPLVRFRNLKYQGAFRVPGDTINGTSFHYGGTAIAYNPDKNSLYMVGHDHHQKVAEVKVPKIINSRNLVDLQTGKFLQNFHDFADGKMVDVTDSHPKVGGLLIYKKQLYGTVYEYYDAANRQTLSHFVSQLDISQPNDVKGPFKIEGARAGFVAGYMAEIPLIWQKPMGGPALTGQCCLAVVGRTSSGAAASVFNPQDLGNRLKTAVNATQVVGYPLDHPLGTGWGSTSDLFNGTTVMAGAVWPEGTRSVLFFGRQGIGEWCYGTGAACNDPVNAYKGTHAYPYVYQIWAYDARDLLAVKNGEKQMWEIKPYDVWQFDLPFSGGMNVIGGVTYDSKNKRIFVSQLRGDNKLPVVHVFKIGGPLK